MSKKYLKPPLTFQQQLQQLKIRGLVIQNEKQAVSQLMEISYYRLSAYWFPFRQCRDQNKPSDSFIEGSSFDEVIELYEFDRKLRLLVIDAIERIEVSIRTLITYHLAHTYGAFAHSNQDNFHEKFEHGKWTAKIEKETERSREKFILHFREAYEGFPKLPIWMITEVMTLGNLSLLYSGLKHCDKKVIAETLGVHHKQLMSWLHTLVYVRNVCAHHSRLWNRELSIRAERTKNKLWQAPMTPRNDRFFYILLMLRWLLRKNKNIDEWQSSCTELLKPIAKNKKWREGMGLPEHWEEHPLWNDGD